MRPYGRAEGLERTTRSRLSRTTHAERNTPSTASAPGGRTAPASKAGVGSDTPLTVGRSRRWFPWMGWLGASVCEMFTDSLTFIHAGSPVVHPAKATGP